MTAQPVTAQAGTSPSREQLRLMVLAARLYHVHGARQREIGERLGMSQAKVSRVLRQAEEAGLVRTVVRVPDGVLFELEEAIEHAHGVLEVHVIDIPEGGYGLAAPLGRAAARLLTESTLAGEVIGFTSWSRTLQELALAIEPAPRAGTRHVVEMLGDLGSPALQHAATRSTQALAAALGAEPVFLRTPGVVTEPALREAVLGDAHVRRALDLLDRLDVALVGVGPADVHSYLSAGDSYFTPDQLTLAREAGAVGQLNQRLIDVAGLAVSTPLDDLVVGSTLDQIAQARRRVVVAGGADKVLPIRAALVGGWVDVLVTDRLTAQSVLT